MSRDQQIQSLEQEIEQIKCERDYFEKWLKTSQNLKERYLARWRHSQENLDEAIKLLSFVYDHAEEHNTRPVPNEQWARAFIERVRGGE